MACARHAIPALDGLRATSIVLVLATHMLPLGPKPLRLNEMTGAMGMSLFFALSGFLIVRALQGGAVRDFIFKRLARILPLAYAYLAFLAITFPQPPGAILAGFGFYLNYKPALVTPLNAHLWSICVEMHFYAAIAVAAAVDRRCLAGVWPCCIAITAIRIGAGAYIDIPTHLRVDEILGGACVATLPQASRRLGWAAPAMLLAALAWAISSHPESGWMQYFRPYAAALLLAAAVRLSDCALLAVLCSKPLRYLATISYALYVLHPLTIYGWWNEGTVFERYVLKRPLSFAAAFAMAHLSTFYWEMPLSRAVRRWLQRRTALLAG